MLIQLLISIVLLSVKKASVDVGRNAEGIFNTLNQNAKAWIDRSRRPLEIESNDLKYARILLLMPEIIDSLDKKLAPILEELAEQIKLHLKVLSSMDQTLKMIREELRGNNYTLLRCGGVVL